MAAKVLIAGKYTSRSLGRLHHNIQRAASNAGCKLPDTILKMPGKVRLCSRLNYLQT